MFRAAPLEGTWPPTMGSINQNTNTTDHWRIMTELLNTRYLFHQDFSFLNFRIQTINYSSKKPSWWPINEETVYNLKFKRAFFCFKYSSCLKFVITLRVLFILKKEEKKFLYSEISRVGIRGFDIWGLLRLLYFTTGDCWSSSSSNSGGGGGSSGSSCCIVSSWSSHGGGEFCFEVLLTPLYPSTNLGIVDVTFQFQLLAVSLTEDPERLQSGVGQLCHRIKIFGRFPKRKKMNLNVISTQAIVFWLTDTWW